MSAEENKEIIRRYVELEIEESEVDRMADEFLDPDFKGHYPELDRPMNLEETKQYFRGFYRGFPDIKATVKEMVAEGERVAVRSLITGTHTGSFFGIAPTGKAISVDDCEIYHVVDGKIVEHWNVYDRYAMLVQMGVITEKAA